MADVYNSQLVGHLSAIDLFHSANYGFEDAFELYHKIQEQDIAGRSPSAIGLPALGHALAGSAGTAISHILLYPLDLVITRLQVQKQLRRPGEAPSAAYDAEDAEYKSLQDAAKKIYENEGGLSAFWNGWKEDTTKSIVDSFLFFLTYTALRQRQQAKLGTRSLPVLDELGVGIAAGAFSKLVTTPIQQIVTRKQTAAMVAARDPFAPVSTNKAKNLSVKDIALQIRSERGLSGFWSGYSASLILTLNPALTFLLQNMLKRIIARSQKKDSPGPKTLFLIAAISKAIASTITYPFSLAKSRAQVSQPGRGPMFTDDTEKNTINITSDKFSEASEKPAYPTGSFEDSSNNNSSSSSSRIPATTRRPLNKTIAYIRRAIHFLIIQRLGNLAVIRSLGNIYRTEGMPGLYSGLDADVVKGFLGHGLSITLKERIHVLIISAYFATLKLTRRWPAELGSIRDQAGKEFERVKTGAEDVAQDLGERVGSVSETVVDGVRNAVKRDE